MSICANLVKASLLDSFVSVLGAKRLFSVGERDKLEALLAESASAQAEVTAQLGVQVRRAVEMLIAAFSFANAEQRRAGRPEPLAGLDPDYVYEAACTVMMRLVFLLYGRGTAPVTAWRRAVRPLLRGLDVAPGAPGHRRQHRQRKRRWSIAGPPGRACWRRSALFYAGLAHDELRLPAYGGRCSTLTASPSLKVAGMARAGRRWRPNPCRSTTVPSSCG